MSITSVKSGATGISLALDNNFMEPIATTLVGSGGVNQVTFNDIPQNYKHLQVRVFGRQTGATTNQSTLVRFNGDAANNYTQHRLVGNGSAASADAYVTGSNGFASWAGIPCANDTASVFGVNLVDILDYTSTAKNKVFRNLSGYDGNGSGLVYFTSGMWTNTSAIVSISLLPQSGNWAQYSRFSLYGIKG